MNILPLVLLVRTSYLTWFGEKITVACNPFDTHLRACRAWCRLQESEAVRATKEREATAAVADREAMKARLLCFCVVGRGDGVGGEVAEVAFDFSSLMFFEKATLRSLCCVDTSLPSLFGARRTS